MKAFIAAAALSALVYVVSAEPPVGNYLPPGQGQGGFGGSPSQQYGAPSKQISSQYGAPSRSYGAPSQSYGAPSGAGGYGDEYNEPAHYNFEYMVKDDHYGTDFGHKEQREGDSTHGEYYVLLPDGRKQIVTYEADEKGYRPKITYEDVGSAGGYGRGPANGGYQQGSNGNGGYNY